MKKFAVYTVGRTGSSLYTNLLKTYLLTQVDLHADDYVYWQPDESHRARWDRPIAHLHSLDDFLSAPGDFERIVTTRSILDSVVSYMIAQATGHWHLYTQSQELDYQQITKDQKIRLDLTDFREWVKDQDRKYRVIFEHLQKSPSDYRVLTYNKHAVDFDSFYRDLGLEPVELPDRVPGAMNVDKFTLVSNLKEILQAYLDNRPAHDFDDDMTIARCQQLMS